MDSANCHGSPQNHKELYNLRHASLRNAIERIFGVLKKRFKVLTDQLEYRYGNQVQLINALCCLHNIIRVIGGDDIYDKEWESEFKSGTQGTNIHMGQGVVTTKAITAAEAKMANELRDGIAEKMWAQYLRCLRQRTN
jgi:hypothetical protein